MNSPMNSDSRQTKVKVVESYLDALRNKDFSGVAFAPNVCFEGPTTPPLFGAAAVIAFLSAQFAAIRDVRVRQHIVEGDCVATLFDFDTIYGVIPVFDLFCVVNGQLQTIRPYFDPTPMRTAKNGDQQTESV